MGIDIFCKGKNKILSNLFSKKRKLIFMSGIAISESAVY